MNILAISKNLSENSISIVIKKSDVIETIRNIHHSLFNKKYKIIEVFLVGIGGVGNTLLNQLKKQQKILQHKNIHIKLCSISNSKKTIFNEKGINLNDWVKEFQKSRSSFNLNKLLEKVKNNKFINPVFIDCTSSEEIAKEYVNILLHHMHIVASNKKANTDRKSVV